MPIRNFEAELRWILSLHVDGNRSKVVVFLWMKGLSVHQIFLFLSAGQNNSCRTKTGEVICHCGRHSLTDIPHHSLQLCLCGQTREGQLRDIFAPWGGRETRRPAPFVCRQMATCLLKKSWEKRTQKVVHTNNKALLSLHWLLFQQSFVRTQLSRVSSTVRQQSITQTKKKSLH